MQREIFQVYYNRSIFISQKWRSFLNERWKRLQDSQVALRTRSDILPMEADLSVLFKFELDTVLFFNGAAFYKQSVFLTPFWTLGWLEN